MFSLSRVVIHLSWIVATCLMSAANVTKRRVFSAYLNLFVVANSGYVLMMRVAIALTFVFLFGCGGTKASSGVDGVHQDVKVSDVIAHMVIENTGPESRRHDIQIRASERTVATELHKFVNPENAGELAAGIKCWALADPQENRYRIRTLCRGEAEVRPGQPGGLVAEGFIYCPTQIGKPSQLELRVSEQSVGETDPDEQYLPVIRVACHS